MAVGGCSRAVGSGRRVQQRGFETLDGLEVDSHDTEAVKCHHPAFPDRHRMVQ